MFLLRDLTVLHVVERRLCMHAADVHQVLEGRPMFHFSYLVQPPAAEGESAEIVVDHLQQTLGGCVPHWLVAPIEVLHLVRCIGCVPHLPLAPD